MRVLAVRPPRLRHSLAGRVAARAVVGSTVALLAAAASLPNAQPSAALSNSRLASASPFVTSSGGQLMLNGSPWRFTGYDSYQLPSLSVGSVFNCGGIYSTAWLDQMLDEMKSASGTTVVRTWFFQSYSVDTYVQLDTVLAAAAQRNIKIIPVLVNQWGDCEPGWGPQGQRPYRTRLWYEGGYKQANDGYPLSFRDYAVNTARRYANNPTIAFWQLVNEAEALDSAGGACDQAAAAGAIRSFADDVTGAIKAVDHNHLVSLGTLGGGQCGIAGPEYQYVHAGAVDLCEYHDYGTSAISSDPWNGDLVDIKACAALGKPIFAGEVGIDTASVGPSPTSAVLQQRAALFQSKLQAQFGHGIAGFLIWSKTLGASGGLGVGPGDPTEATMAAFQRQLVPGSPAPSPSAPPAASGAQSAPAPASARQTTHPASGPGPLPQPVPGAAASSVPSMTPTAAASPAASGGSAPLRARVRDSDSTLAIPTRCNAVGAAAGSGPGVPLCGVPVGAVTTAPPAIALAALGTLAIALGMRTSLAVVRRRRLMTAPAAA